MASRSEDVEFLPWEQALSAFLPLPRWSAAPLISVALIAGFFLFRAAFDLPLRDDSGTLTLGTRVSIALALLIGILLFLSQYMAIAELTDRRELGLEDAATEAVGESRRGLRVSRIDIVRSRWAGAFALIAGLGVVQGFAAIRGDSPLAPWTQAGDHTYSILLNPLFFWLVGRGLFFTYEESRSFRRRAHRGTPLHLFRLGHIDVFGRMALRRALVWILVLSVGSLMFGLNPDVTLANMLPMVPVFLLCIVFASISMLAPLRVAHDSVAAAKRRELELIDAAISGDRDAIRSSLIANHEGDPSLADLIAYRGLVASISEWPFDGTSLSRLLLYLLIPIASWVGGAFVEQLISTLIER